MATHTAIVDDRDPLIQYGGSWVPGGVPVEFDSTTMTTVDAGSTATFSFIGTSVTVYATVASKTLEIQPIWSFVVDGTVTGTYTPPNTIPPDGVHHQVLWTSSASPLQNGSHTLVITQSQAASGSNKVIFMDYITYTTTSASVESYFIDDRDPQIKYTPAWRQFGSDGDFEHTSQATSSVGDFLTFTFEGKSIAFYGGVTSETANASITIDGGPPKFWLPPVGVTTNNLIFDSGDLSPGNHTLVVTAENDQPVWADYFLVTPNPPGSVNTSSPSSPGSTPPIQKHKSTPIGVIVGPIIGVLALAALAAAAFFFIWRRRRREHESPDRPAPTMSTAHVLDPGHAFGYSGYNVPATAVPPPLLHGYSSHSQVGLLPTPNSYGDPSSALATAGVSYSDPSTSHPNPTLPSTGYPSTSHPTRGTPLSSAPNSASSGDYVPPLTPQRRSHKLLREVERSHQLRVPSPSVSGSASISGSTELPPHYTE